MTSIKLAARTMSVVLMLLAFTACTGPTPSATPAQRPASAPDASLPVTTSQTEAAAATGGSTPMHTRPAPAMSGPLPPEPVTQAGKPPAIDQSCRTSADCVVKDVGSCCGAMPACVNRNSRTDPGAVQADCARKGMSSVCGFNDITACACADGQCISEQEPVGGWINGAAPPQADR